MLKEVRTEDNYEVKVKKVVQQLESKGYENIRADIDEYEPPASYTNRSDNTQFVPDITATKDGSKFYFEISMKTEEQTKLAGKWRLLSTLAEMKNGMLKIFAPHGQMAFTNRILKKHNINCEVASMPA